MRTFFQALKPFTSAFLKFKESGAVAGKLAETAGRYQQRPLSLGPAPGDADALARHKSGLVRDVHHEQARRAWIAKIYQNLLPPAPTHVPDAARMLQLREAKMINAMLPAVPTHVPKLKIVPPTASTALSRRSVSQKPAVARSPSKQFAYRPLPTAARVGSIRNDPRLRSNNVFQSKVVLQERLGETQKNIATIQHKIDLLNKGLARTSDPARQIRILRQRVLEQARLRDQTLDKMNLESTIRRARGWGSVD